MIKRWILHFEFHWGYWPRISIKRVPRPGDWVFDGGEWGQLVACRECGGDGLLHLVTPKQYMQAKPESLWPAPPISDHVSPPAMDFNADWKMFPLPLIPETSKYKVGNRVGYRTEQYLIHAIGSDLDGGNRFMHLKPATNPTMVGSPDHLILGYELGTVDHQPGSEVWTNGAEYIVDSIYIGELYLTRKDIWEQNKSE